MLNSHNSFFPMLPTRSWLDQCGTTSIKDSEASWPKSTSLYRCCTITMLKPRSYFSHRHNVWHFFCMTWKTFGKWVLCSQTYIMANNFYTTVSGIIIINRNVFPLLLATTSRVANISLQFCKYPWKGIYTAIFPTINKSEQLKFPVYFHS